MPRTIIKAGDGAGSAIARPGHTAHMSAGARTLPGATLSAPRLAKVANV